MFQGDGILYHHSGSRYEGGFSNGRMYGKGTFTWNDGATYIGDFDLLEKKVCEGMFTFDGKTCSAVLDGDRLSVRREDSSLEFVRRLQ